MRQTVPILPSENRQHPVHSESSQQRGFLVKIYPAVVSGSLILLDRQVTFFGRDTECEYELTDDHSSRFHSKFVWEGDDCLLRDLGSTNGTFVNEVRISQCCLKHGDQIRIGTNIFKFLSARDVEAMYHEAVFQMMTVDALTQTYNRRYFDDVFQRESLRSVRYQRSLGLLLLDIDHFKNLNDTYGHLVGDEILTGMCQRISKRFQRDEVFARIGGEEFAIALIEVSPEFLRDMGESLCRTVSAEPFSTSQGAVQVTLSIGGAHAAGDSPIAANVLYERADQQLYRSKAAGRNRYFDASLKD